VSEVLIKGTLHPGQAAIYNSPARYKVVAAGRRFGKSYFAALTLIQAAMATEHRGIPLTPDNATFYVAPTFGQAKQAVWAKIRIIAGFKHQGGLIVNENVNDGWIELVSGRKIHIKGADDPERLRGAGLNYVVLDEYADMKPHVWDEIIEPALMDVEGDALFIGTPKGKNHFYKIFMGALMKPVDDETGDNEHWQEYEAFHFKSDDNPFLSARAVKKMRSNPRKSKAVIRQEMDASFITGGNRELKSENFPILAVAPSYASGSIVITVDLAGFKKQDGSKKILKTDEHVICTTLAIEDRWYVLDMQHGHWGTREVALKIVNTLRKYPGARLGIEDGALSNAVSEPLNDYMRSFSRYVHVDPLKHNNQRKVDRIIWSLQGRSERGLIAFIKGDWNEWMAEQLDDFPDPLAHDDGPDALAYVDQMVVSNYVDEHDAEEWQPLDLVSGY
jgi:predicted phage terminase large subunit-like protein